MCSFYLLKISKFFVDVFEIDCCLPTHIFINALNTSCRHLKWAWNSKVTCTSNMYIFFQTFDTVMILIIITSDGPVLWSPHQQASVWLGLLQSSAIIAQSNIVRYYKNNYRNWGRLSIRFWIYRRHPVPHPWKSLHKEHRKIQKLSYKSLRNHNVCKGFTCGGYCWNVKLW